MTNEMKLLRAFIEAAGYEIEEIELSPAFGYSHAKLDYKVTKKAKQTAKD